MSTRYAIATINMTTATTNELRPPSAYSGPASPGLFPQQSPSQCQMLLGQPNVSRSGLHLCHNSSHAPTFESCSNPWPCCATSRQQHQTTMIVNEFCHEFSVSSSPTALPPTDSGRLSINDYSDFPHPSTQDPRPFFSPSLFSSCSETVRVAI